MSYCPRCGKELPAGANFCPNCGMSQGATDGGYPAYEVDAPNFILALVGFFVPLAGFIMYLYWHDRMPLKARSAGKGALISVILHVVVSIILTILVVIFGAQIYSYGGEEIINHFIFK